MNNEFKLKEVTNNITSKGKKGMIIMKEKTNKMMNLVTKGFTAIGFIVVIAAITVFVMKVGDKKHNDNHDTQITRTIVEEKLVDIGEINTSEFTYSGTDKITDSRQVAGINVPFTKHTIEYSYEGIIKVGYRISDIEISVFGSNIYVTIPKPYETTNAIEVINCKENNNIFNPIASDEITSKLPQIKEEELARAIEEYDIYVAAELQLKNLIDGALAEFVDMGYSVVYR